ncbi:unnamed protein product [Cuscuta epithymum]|uniref:Uncharacterized protein n=1 Tax=Cuscuta epithymum TaxID=186058 RepID=A0AAV0EXU7_9ASTE|nr:unnamed protein product [Cuscuta epithymum]
MVPGNSDCWLDRRRMFHQNGFSPNGKHSGGHLRDGRPGGSSWRHRRHRATLGSHPPLRHHAPDDATKHPRDQSVQGRAPETRAHQLPSFRAGLRLAHVGLLQSARHHGVPGGGPEGLRRNTRRAQPPEFNGARGQVLDQAVGSGGAGPAFQGGAGLLGEEVVPARQPPVQAGSARAPQPRLRQGVGPDHDRRAQGVLRGGAGEDGVHLLGGGDGAQQEAIWCDARVPARREPQSGEGVCGAVLV